MLNRNYDNLTTKRMFPTKDLNDIPYGQKNSNLVFQDTFGGYHTVGSDATYIRSIPFLEWSNAFYCLNNSAIGLSGSQTGMWAGGSGGLKVGSNISGIKKGSEDYDDYNLFHPFYGNQNDPGRDNKSYDIYPQDHYFDDPVYDATNDRWTRTVHREFRNISGQTLTVEEVGIYYQQTAVGTILLSREILDTPITVVDRDYFQLAYTYVCQNPHANEEVKKIRQYTCPIRYYASSVTSLSGIYTPPSDIEQNDFVLFAIENQTTSSSPTEGTLTGTGLTDITKMTSTLLPISTSATNPQIREEIWSAKISGNSAISFRYACPGNNAFTTMEMIPFKNTVTSLVCVESTIVSGQHDFEVSKSSTDRDILWVIGKDLYANNNNRNITQIDENYCDVYTPYLSSLDYNNYNKEQHRIFVDSTTATQHSFSTDNGASAASISAVPGNYSIHKIKATCTTLLYQETNS